ncbi:hypothetical protein ID866_12529, partial [Astraeus odoratus]
MYGHSQWPPGEDSEHSPEQWAKNAM